MDSALRRRRRKILGLPIFFQGFDLVSTVESSSFKEFNKPRSKKIACGAIKISCGYDRAGYDSNSDPPQTNTTWTQNTISSTCDLIMIGSEEREGEPCRKDIMERNAFSPLSGCVLSGNSNILLCHYKPS